jgi:hypothetical protein
MVVRAARSILNKLTVEKFESLFGQLVGCGIQQPHHVSMLMREIFEKATIQHNFIPMYADLCVRLEKDETIVAVVKEAGELHDFRRLLLNQCQIVFEQVLEPTSNESDKPENCRMSDEEIILVRKQRALGNIKLIGHLLVLGMLSSDLFVGCCEQLIRSRAECPEALEALVALMFVAGPYFDSKDWQFYSRLEAILSEMKVLTKDKATPPRLRFLIRDVLDAREGSWPGSPKEKSPATQLKDSVKSDAPVEAKAAPTEPKAKAAPAPEGGFDLKKFRRTLAVVIEDLAADKNVPAAVKRIRDQQVPVALQADQFVDIISRVVEERHGAVRRCQLAFVAGLVTAENSAFDRKECVYGLKLFFQDVYNDLCDEVARLPAIMKSELMPLMHNVYPSGELNSVVPVMMQR